MIFCIGFSASAQCTLGPGDLVITGYDQLDDGTSGSTFNDSFSFLLLKDIPAGQVIFFTDLGWTGSSFQTASNAPADAVLRWTADVAYAAGTEIIVYCKFSPSSKDINGIARGTITVEQPSFNTSSGAVSPAEQMSLAEFSGDQIFAFTNSIAAPTFLAGISINRPAASQWDAVLLSTTFASDKSTLPASLASGAQNMGVSFVDPGDPFVNAAPVARYKRDVAGNATGLASALLTKINNVANWEIRSDGNNYVPLFSATQINVTGISITAQPINRTNLCPGSSTSFTVAASPVCTYQWEVSNDGVNFTAVVAGGVYSNVTTATLSISNVSTLNNKKYRVKLTGAHGTTSNIVNLTLLNPTVVLNPGPLAAAVPNVAYSQSANVTSGGSGTFTYTLDSGTLPTGLSLNGSTGAITGTPTVGGSYSFVIKATDNCSSPNSGTQSYTIIVGTLNQVITLTDYSKTYGDATFTLPATTDAGLTISYTSATPAVATVTGNTVTIVGAGTTNITATQGGNASYNPATPVTKEIAVAKKAITITADMKTKEYGQADPALTQSITTGGPLVGTDVLSGDLGRAPGENAGNYAINIGTLTAGNNYLTTFVGANFSITAKPLTLALNASPLITKAYDNNASATLAAANYTLTGLINSDAVTVTGTATYNDEDVAAGKTITANTFVLAGLLKDNYNLTTTTATTTGDITALPITLTLNASPLITKVYDDQTTANLVAGNYTLNGVLGLDVVTVSGTADYDTKAIGTGKTITANTFVLAGPDKDNYSLTTTTATTSGDISTKPITLTLNATPLITKVYDDNNTATLAAGNYSLSGVLGTNVVTVSGAATYDTKTTGTGKTVTATTFVLAGADKDNYNLTTTTATTTGEITALPLTLVLNATPLITKIYDNNNTATLLPANYTLTGVLGTDVVTVSGSATYDNADVATGKTVTANTFVLAGTDKDNYSLSTTTATTTGDISTKAVTLALNAAPLITKVYDNNTAATLVAANYTLTGVLGTDVVTVSGNANYDTKATGTGKTITANTFVLAGAQQGNYNLTTTTATTTGEITALPLTLALNATPLITKAYDNNNTATLLPANYDLSGVLGTDAVTVSGTATYDTKDAGTGKTVTANTFVLAGADKDNYSLSTLTATTTGEVTASPITLALNALPLITKTYDGDAIATLVPANYTLTGILGVDAVTVSGTASYDSPDAATGKTITANTFVLAGADKDNYSLSTTTATTTGNIVQKSLTLALNATPLITKVYDDNNTATLVPANYDLTGVLGTDVVTVSGTATYDTKATGTGKTVTANTFVLAGAQQGNYNLTTTTATTTGEITALPLTLALNATPLITKEYDNNNTATLLPANYTLTGVLGTDVVTVSGSATYDNADVATGKTITANTFVLAGADKDNYSLSTTTASTTGDISTKAITLALNAAPLISKAYDGNTTANPASANYTLTGILGADVVTVSGTANYDTKATGTGKTITANNFVLAGAQQGNYNLTTTTATTTGEITALPLTLALNATPLITKAYDNNNTATLLPANYDLSGVLGTDAVTVSGTATYDTKDAGTGKTVTANTFVLAGADKDNYSLSTLTATTTGEVTASPITLALNALPLISKTYDGDAIATLVPANYTLTGVLGVDAVTVSGTASYDSPDAATGKTITANTFVLAGPDKDNYSLSTTTATTTGNIVQKSLTLALNATPLISKVYDDNTLATLVPANYTLNGVLGTDALTVTGTANYDTKATGTGKTITANTFVLAGAQQGNYNLTTTTATTTGDITALPLTLALNASPLITKVYDNNNTATLAPANYTLTGILGTDAVTVSGTATYDSPDAGTGKTVTANTFVLAGADKDNYSLSTTTASTTGDISTKAITLALNAAPLISKAYDGNTTANPASANYTLTGILGADVVTVSGTANYDTKATGTGKTITAGNFVLAGAQQGNYNLTTTTATTTGDITAMPLTLALNATPLITKVYDNNNTATLAPANYALTGILGTDAVTVSGTATYDTKDAGTGKTITANAFVLAGADKDNYSLATTTATTTGEVTASPVTLTLNALPVISKTYDGNISAILTPAHYNLNGILGTDVVVVSSDATYDNPDAGTGKTVTANNFVLLGAQKDNYSLTTPTATTTGNIVQKSLTLALNATPLISKVYDDNTLATLVPANYNLTGILGTDAVTVTGTANYDTKATGTGKTITANTFVLAGAQQGNYNLTTTTATTTGDITALPLTLALNASPLITKVYDNNNTATLAPANYTLTGILGTDAVTVSGTATYDSPDAGTGKTVTANTFVLAGADKDNYSLSTTTASTTGDISTKAITLALNAAPLISKAYDGNTTANPASANYTLTGILGADVVTVSGTANYDTKATGTGKTITAGNFVLAGAQQGNYNLTTTTATTTGDITAMPLTLALNATPLITKVYDNNNTATLAPANYALTGILGTDAVTVSGTATYDTKDAGTGKTITANAFVLAGADKDNYSLATTTASTTGDISSKAVTLALNALPLISKTYDGNISATLTPAHYTLNGILGTDIVVVSGDATYDNPDAGTGKTVTANNFVLLGAQKDNYSLTTPTATTTGNIVQKSLTLALNATPLISKVYDDNTLATLVPANYNLTGILGADVVTVSGTANYDTKATGTGKTVTANTFVLAGAQQGNYNLTTTTATTTGDITALPLTLALNASPLITKVYDDNNTATLAPANYTLTGILGTDAVTVSGTATYDTKDAGTGKTVTANTFVLAGADKDNYSLSTTTASSTGDISTKAITLALNAAPLISKVYDDNTLATLVPANYTLTGILGSDAVSVSGTANYDTKATGTGKTITANTFVLAGAQQGNYNLTTTTATTTGDITAMPLTLALNATPLITKVYDNNNTATLAPANYALTGVLGTDAVTVSGTATYDTKDAGAGKTITANAFVLAGADKDNYSLSTTTASTTGDISSKAVTLALNASPLISKAYDGSTTASLATGNYTLAGILGTDVVTVSGTANYDTKTTGTGKTITANNFVLAGAQQGNYNLSTTTATTTGDITALPITLALNASPLITKVYDDNTTATLAPANYALTGVLGTDAVTVSGSATYDNPAAATGKTITANTFVLAGADKDNYTLSTTTATTTGNITAAPLTLTLNATPLISKIYDGNTAALLVAGNYSLTGLLGTDVVTVSGTASYDNKTTGTGKTVTADGFVLAGVDKDNYSLTTTTATTTGNITASPITLALNATPLISKAYDGNTTAVLAAGNYTLNGIIGADVVNVSGTANYDNKNAGTGKTVTGNAFVLNGADKDNYSLTTTTASTTGEITLKTITASLNAAPIISKVYDNTTIATLAAGNYSLNGVLGADAVTVSASATYDNKTVGTGKTITANTFVLAGPDKDNYALSTTNATTTGHITASPLTLTLHASPLITKTYDNTTAATLSPANFSLNGILGADQVAVSGTANYNNEDTGNGKTINAGTFVLSGTDKDNYTLSTTIASTTGNITWKDLTVTADDKSRFQGTANPPLTLTYNGFVTGEGISNLSTAPVASTLANVASPIGDYDITVSGGLATNYNFIYVNGTLKVLPGAPTAILLASTPLYENRPAGTTAGTLSSTSEIPSAVYTYSLVAGAGDTDNSAFSIVDDQIRSTAAFDFETKSSYSIRVRSTTQFGLSLDKQFTISISDVNEIPTLSPISNQTICYTTATQNVPLTGISAGPETAQTNTLTLQSSNANLLQNLTVTPTGANGNISYRVKNGASGTATITVTVKDNGGTANGGVDTYTRTFVITVNPLPVVMIHADRGTVNGNSTEVSKGETVLLTASGGSTYAWSAHNSIISGQNGATLTVRPRETTTYMVTVTNANGCTETATFKVNVLDDLAKIKGTNILTPNGDGYNDKWVVDNIDFYPNNEVKVFDKSGRIVYSKRGYDNSWDGTFNGTALTEGTYYYLIDFGSNRLKFRGFITIVRED
ncbi:hypothetical protein BFS30_26885 [Pedobacter steynii]|uniref:Cadherin domain-containing protein n=2 Tax=Pedobacter steynii TaxID=430522 RepID=A0A1D7QP77_9SPHI|nr:hypothetical protein BFS30_26885 [Pedobacter steynii]